MTNEQIETFNGLWREAMAKGLVRWVPGMLLRVPGREPLRIAAEFLPSVWSGICGEQLGHDYAHNVGDDALPVPDDPATVGCILAIAREVTGDDRLHVYWCAFALEWIAMWFPTAADCRTASGTTELEALLRAILAAGGAK